MISNILNQNFGYSVTCDGYWAAVGNPNPFRYTSSFSSSINTGSIEIYKYNINSDTHETKIFLYRPLSISESVLLSTENNNTGLTGPDYIIQTEYTGTIPYTANMNLSLEQGFYSPLEDGYGWAIDLKETILAVGDPYFTSTSSLFIQKGSGSVDLYDLSTLDVDPYAKRIPPTIVGSQNIGGLITITVNVPASQNYTSIIFQILNNNIWQNISIGQTSNSGGTISIQTGQISLSGLTTRVIGIIGTNPYLTTIYNPNPIITSSFGYSVSLNDEWLAVGSPAESGSSGAIFMFRKINNNNLSWSFFQTLNNPPNISVGDNFGSSVSMNKNSSSYSWSMVVGSSKLSSSNAYIYKFNGSNWSNTQILYPNSSSIYPLNFYSTVPIVQNYPNTHDSFGHSVSMYGSSIIVGAPTDRTIQENLSSSLYQQGSVYFFEQCSDVNTSSPFYLVKKSYGNGNTIKNNFLGQSVSLHDGYAVAGCPKINTFSSSICFLRGSLFQEHFCNDDIDATLNGQFILYNKMTSSISTSLDWDIVNVYQVKKQFLSPYRVYGWDVNISDQFILIGSPMLISGSSTVMDLTSTTGSFTGSVNVLGDLSGKSYIYNLNNFRESFYVGNVFYRNGKIVIMTSGSAFEGLQFNTIVDEEYQYQLNFTSQQKIFEKQIVCNVEIGEFNVSTNPTSLTPPNIEFDINNNGVFDFQDADVLLRYMSYQNTKNTGTPVTDWSSSVIDTTTDEEMSVYNMYYSQWKNTDSLFSSSYSYINNNISTDLDLNGDNKMNYNDMNILWKYFIHRLDQKNYGNWITPNSQNRFLADIIDYLNSKTLRGQPPQINPVFSNYSNYSSQDPTGSYLSPVATTIGIYSGTDLIMCAKLGSPIKITGDFPVNFIIRMDF